jgi:hypothetical protein
MDFIFQYMVEIVAYRLETALDNEEATDMVGWGRLAGNVLKMKNVTTMLELNDRPSQIDEAKEGRCCLSNHDKFNLLKTYIRGFPHPWGIWSVSIKDMVDLVNELPSPPERNANAEAKAVATVTGWIEDPENPPIKATFLKQVLRILGKVARFPGMMMGFENLAKQFTLWPNGIIFAEDWKRNEKLMWFLMNCMMQLFPSLEEELLGSPAIAVGGAAKERKSDYADIPPIPTESFIEGCPAELEAETADEARFATELAEFDAATELEFQAHADERKTYRRRLVDVQETHRMGGGSSSTPP